MPGMPLALAVPLWSLNILRCEILPNICSRNDEILAAGRRLALVVVDDDAVLQPVMGDLPARSRSPSK